MITSPIDGEAISKETNWLSTSRLDVKYRLSLCLRWTYSVLPELVLAFG